MGGAIWVESEKGEGSTFSFTARFERGKEPLPAARPAANWKNIRVMAVDDDLSVLEYFAELARRFELACDTAPGGEEAVALIEKNGGYDIYFVDWKMPGMDGNALTRYIKERNDGHSVVVMISSVEWTAIEDDAKKAGVDRFLPKPLFPSAIADTINECLGRDLIAADLPEENQTYRGKRLLLAEDVEINREIVISLLEPLELEIDCAENGKEAVEKFRAAPDSYDLVFMDVQMPEMDGYEATRQIRAFERSRREQIRTEQRQQPENPAQAPAGIPKSVPIIAMTANVFKEDVEKCLAAGMNSHVGKPLDMEEVFHKLKDFLR